MRKLIKYIGISITLLHVSVHTKSYSPHMITFTFQNYPTMQEVRYKNTHSGIFVSYFGYMATSNKIGEIILPRKHQKPSFSLLICTNPQPIFMLQNTIHHWQVPDDAKYKFYTISRENDDYTKLYFWNVKKSDLPANKHLPIDTLMVFSNPESIFVPEGITLTTKNPQLVLPTLYTKVGANSPSNALAALELRTFFDPIDKVYQIGKGETQSQTNTL